MGKAARNREIRKNAGNVKSVARRVRKNTNPKKYDSEGGKRG